MLLVAPISAKIKKQQQWRGVGSKDWQRATDGEREHLLSSNHQPPSADPPLSFSRQHRPKDLSILQQYTNLIKIKYCEDTRPQSQLSATQEQHKDLL